jgi:hypothetical protein
MTAAREEDLLAGAYPDIHGVLPGANVVDASGYAINANGITLGAEIDDGSMDYDSYEYSYRYATYLGGAGAPEDLDIIPERQWAAMLAEKVKGRTLV